MKITIDPFEKKSIDVAIKNLKQYKKEFAIKESEFIRRLAEIGVRIASGTYTIADYDGTKGIIVRMVKNSKGYAVVAEGETVGFVEFGTGVRNREWSGDNLDYTPPSHGTYGDGHGKQSYGWWFNPSDGGKAVHTHGNPPAEGMLSARDAMVHRVAQIAREVWR